MRGQKEHRSRGGPRGLPTDFRRGFEEAYAHTNYRELPWFSPRPYPWLVQALDSGWIVPPGPVLDVGCGAGTNVLWLARQGFRASGVDLAPSAIAAAERRMKRARLSATFRVGDVLALPFRRGAFQAALDVGCFHSLPIARRPDYAKELARVVRHGGSFLLSWVAREETGKFGPPHRPSVVEIARTFEGAFVIERIQYAPSRSSRGWPTRGGRLAQYSCRLIRRSTPQPPLK
ncbi:MAG: class I SAM-dependent methyltransferase [Thermoplasmata archaeon]|nr:class I SAM-dependent methyltransferase [Thermoplasmata archaeon]